jgi:hypothetical protein
MWSTGVDERIWLRSDDATGPSPFAMTIISFPSSVAVRGEAIAEMSKWRRKGFHRSDLKIISSDPDLAAIEKALEALNARQ